MRQAVAPITSAIADGGNGIRNRQGVSDNEENHNHIHNNIKEVINNNYEHPGFPVITGWLEQPANRQ